MTYRDPSPDERPILVSACLLGLPTRYNGSHCRREATVAMTAGRLLVPVCPEQLGGFPTPREPAQISEGDGEDVLEKRSRVINGLGVDVTIGFLRGAEAVGQLAELLGARRAIFKEGSPSCGVTRIQRAGKDVRAAGVTTMFLRRKGIHVDGIE